MAEDNGRVLSTIGHGDFRPAMAPRGEAGLRPASNVPQHAGERAWNWLDAPLESCQATTKAGGQCQAALVKGESYCTFHLPKE